MENSGKDQKAITKKPLTQILDEMDENIRVAAEAARRAEEAAARAERATQAAASVRGFLVVFEKAGRNYSAYLPDVPGCIATGKTREEVEKNIKKAISFHFAGLAKDGLAIPKPTSFTKYIEV